MVTDTACMGDNRSRIVRWWHRKTIHRGGVSIDGSLLVNVTVHLDWLDRLLIMLGRNIEVETRTPADDETIFKAVEGCKSSFTTLPRRRGRG